MAIRALYDMKDIPLPLAVDLYAQTFVPSIDKESEPVYSKMTKELKYDMIASSQDIAVDWSRSNNKLLFTKGYVDLFEKSCVQAIWIAYEALRMVFSCHQDLKTADLQVMYWRDIKFWIKQEQDYVVFLTPDEY